MEVERTEYLKQLLAWKDEQVIKVITGIRRCGKSTLLKQYQSLLRQAGVSDAQMIAINFEDLDNEPLLDYGALHQYVKERLVNDKMYLFFDEIQRVPSFEKVINSLSLNDNIDIYLTGSNAYLLSSELATFLSGRYVSIQMLPLSFMEYCQLSEESNSDLCFYQYLKSGGFPYVSQLKSDDTRMRMYIEGIYNTIILKDIEERMLRKYNTDDRKSNDINLLKSIIRYLANSIGSIISHKSIADYITSSGRKVSQTTISEYIESLTEAYIIYPVERYNISGKQLLKTNKKYYITDLGIRTLLISKTQHDLGACLENIVYLELLRRGFEVHVGYLDQVEIDFVVKKNGISEYIQVTASLMDEMTFEREIRPLRGIRDQYKKCILTLDRMTMGNYDGIEVINVIDWLLAKT